MWYLLSLVFANLSTLHESTLLILQSLFAGISLFGARMWRCPYTLLSSVALIAESVHEASIPCRKSASMLLVSKGSFHRCMRLTV